MRTRRLSRVWADAGYQGRFEKQVNETLPVTLEIARRRGEGKGEWAGEGEPPARPEGFVVVKWRWIVERTFGWLGRYRRLTRDYERRVDISRAHVLSAMVSLMVSRLAG